MPRVLISDELSDAAVQIFRDRGVEVDFQPKLGKDPEKLASIIGEYDGLAIRSATKANADLIAKADRLKVIGRAGSVFNTFNIVMRLIFIGVFSIPFFSKGGNISFSFIIMGIFLLAAGILMLVYRNRFKAVDTV